MRQSVVSWFWKVGHFAEMAHFPKPKNHRLAQFRISRNLRGRQSMVFFFWKVGHLGEMAHYPEALNWPTQSGPFRRNGPLSKTKKPLTGAIWDFPKSLWAPVSAFFLLGSRLILLSWCFHPSIDVFISLLSYLFLSWCLPPFFFLIFGS